MLVSERGTGCSLWWTCSRGAGAHASKKADAAQGRHMHACTTCMQAPQLRATHREGKDCRGRGAAQGGRVQSRHGGPVRRGGGICDIQLAPRHARAWLAQARKAGCCLSASSLVSGTMLDIKRLIATLPARRMSSRAAGRAGLAGVSAVLAGEDMPGESAATRCILHPLLLPRSSGRLA